TVTQESDRARQVARARIRQAGVEARNVRIVLAARSEQIPAQAIVQRQLTGDLPVVLREEGLVLIPDAGNDEKAVGAGVVDGAKEEARKRVAAAGASGGGRKGCFVRIESEQPLLVGAIGAIGLLPAHIGAELEAVIAVEDGEGVGELQGIVHLHALVL